MHEILTIIESVGLYILSAIGGGAVLTAGIIKWSSGLISDSIQKRIETNHQKELEKYKHELDEQTSRANMLLDRISHVSVKQYDKEFEIYLGVWEDMIKCRQSLLDLYNTFLGQPAFDFEEHKSLIKKKLDKYSTAYSNYSNTILKHAPFYEDQFYSAFIKISNLMNNAHQILSAASNTCHLTNDQKNILNTNFLTLEEAIRKVQNDMRTYLHSLRVVHDV